MTNTITTRKEKNQIAFKDLESGDIFSKEQNKYKKTVYLMKVAGRGVTLKSNEETVNALNLTSGEVYYSPDEELVTREKEIHLSRNQ